MDQQTNTPHIVNNNTVSVNGPTPNSMGVLQRKWLTALLLSIFLGWIGIDRFYLGKTGTGLLKFFTFGLFGILWTIDIVMIATRSVRGIAWVD
jgi:TM2 domain-containing membrane protein YozV